MYWELIQLSFSQLNLAPALFTSDKLKTSDISDKERISLSGDFIDHPKNAM